MLIFFPSVAVVGLEKTHYLVSEDIAVFWVCAVVYNPGHCPIDFSFSVGISTTDTSAGSIILL